MPKLYFLFCILFSNFLIGSTQDNSAVAMTNFPLPYQDILIQNRIVQLGSDICDTRYALLKKVLETYKRPFTVLDIGACEGYFSFKIAEEYPQSVCVAIEGGARIYPTKPNTLLQLCHLNSHLNNIIFLHKFLTLDLIEKLHSYDHFDVVLALLVIHLIADTPKNNQTYMQRVEKCTKEILDLGNDVVIELSYPDVNPEIIPFIESLCKEHGGICLGHVRRHKSGSNNFGVLYWFHKDATTAPSDMPGLRLNTFYSFGGAYPSQKEVQAIQERVPLLPGHELVLQGKERVLSRPLQSIVVK